jgi:hypothetical protein
LRCEPALVKTVDGAALVQPNRPRNATQESYLHIEPRATRRVHMPHRPYGIPSPKPRPTYSGSTRAAWSGGAIIGGMILMVIVLGFIMYEVTKIGSHARNPATTAPHTTGQPEHGHPASMGGSGWQRSVRLLPGQFCAGKYPRPGGCFQV